MIRSCDQVRFYMSKFLYLLSSAFVGILVSGFVWAILFALLAFVEKVKTGNIDFQIGFLSVDLKITEVSILSALLGIFFGVFIGLSIGLFKIESFFAGGLCGFLTIFGIIIFWYVNSAVSSFFANFSKGNFQQALNSIDFSNFIIFSVIVLIPSFLSGAITAKLQPFILKMF